MSAAQCHSCHAPVVWTVVDKSGATTPIDPDPRDDGNLEMTGRMRGTRQGGVAPEVSYITQEALIPSGKPRFVSHFATCPNADKHRRGH